MKIYQITSGGETEWVCANTVFQALKYYNSITDLELSDYDDEDDITEVPESKWSEMNITDPDDLDDEGNPKVIQTFAERVKEETIPDIIASTAY